MVANVEGRNKVPLIPSANAYYTEWGSTNCNTRGESLFEFIISSNLNIENVGCKPTFVTRKRRGVLDVNVMVTLL